MNGIRKLLGLVTMLSLAAFALPGIAAKPPQAQAKSYSVEFLLPSMAVEPDGTTLRANPLYVPGAVAGDWVIKPPVTVTVYIKNESPPSTAASNISSLTFDLAPSLVLVNDPLVANPTCPRAQCAVSGNTVFVSNISPPIQGQEVYPITLQVNTCVVAGEAFISNVNVYSGSSFNGDTFSQIKSDVYFQPQLTLSTRGTDYPIDFTQAVTPTVTGISCGNIACAQSFTIGNLDPSNLDYRVVTGWRGLNADGTCGDTSHLPYFVTNKLGVTTDTQFPATNQSAHFVWPGDATTTPVFAYKLTRNGTGTEWDVAWLPKPSLSPVAIPAPVCNGGLLASEPTTIDALPLPRAYGVLAQDVKVNTKKFKVDTGVDAPPTVPSGGLPIIVQTERMLVTSIDSSGWSVTRTNPVFHAASSTVASTPMPLLPLDVISPYTGGAPAEMCIVWTDGTSAWFIDESDGWGLSR